MRRRRRGRGLLVGVGAIVVVGLVAGSVYVAHADGGGTVVAGPGHARTAADALAAVGVDDVVLTVDEELPNPSGFTLPYSVLVFDKAGDQQANIASADIDALLAPVGQGPLAQGRTSVKLVALDSRLSRAIFSVSNPVAYMAPTVALLNLKTGEVVLADPCGSTLDSIDLSPWCSSEPAAGSATVTDPATGGTVLVQGYDECVGASARFVEVVAASCVRSGSDGYLVTVSPQDGRVVTSVPTGIGLHSAPWVVDGKLFVNSSGTDSGPFLLDSSGNSVTVGGGPVAGLGVVGDRLLVQTSSDVYGAESSYGHVLGLWSPTTGEFAALPGTSLQPGAIVELVDVIR